MSYDDTGWTLCGHGKNARPPRLLPCSMLLQFTIAANGLQHPNYGTGCRITVIKIIHLPYCVVITYLLHKVPLPPRLDQRLRFPTQGTPLVC